MKGMKSASPSSRLATEASLDSSYKMSEMLRAALLRIAYLQHSLILVIKALSAGPGVKINDQLCILQTVPLMSQESLFL